MIYSKQKHVGCKKVTWPRKTAATIKELIWECGQGLCNNNINATWDEIVGPISGIQSNIGYYTYVGDFKDL